MRKPCARSACTKPCSVSVDADFCSVTSQTMRRGSMSASCSTSRMSRSAASATARSTNSDGSKLMKIAASGSRQAPALSRCSVRVSVSTCSRSAGGIRLKKVPGDRPSPSRNGLISPSKAAIRHLAAVEGEDRLERALERKHAPHADRGAVVLADDVGKADAARHFGSLPFEHGQPWHARFYRSLTDDAGRPLVASATFRALAIPRNLSTLRRAAARRAGFPGERQSWPFLPTPLPA